MVRGIGIGVLAVGVLLLLAPAAPAVDEARIKQAIGAGVKYIKSQQRDGSWAYGGPAGPDLARPVTVGMTALAAMTLLECKVKPTDPHIKDATAFLRQQCLTNTETYSLSLAIMFFDLLGDPQDEDLIASMVVRLIAGQNASEGWTYRCPALSPEMVNSLKEKLRQRSVLVAQGKLPATSGSEPDKERDVRAKLVQEQAQQLSQQNLAVNQFAPNFRTAMSDNSNTQFALLALWVARRHGLPVDDALAHVYHRFRMTQNGDGGWPYQTTMGRGSAAASTPTMTCAGLLGLGVGHGVANASRKNVGQKNAQRELSRDRSVKMGFQALGASFIGRLGPIQPGSDYYLLWSIERVAMVYSVKRIGGVDWYTWGSKILLRRQGPDGGWHDGKFSQGGADTCFALLFLKRANVAKDLSTALRGQLGEQATLKAKDLPGEHVPTVSDKGLGLGAKAGREPAVKQPKEPVVSVEKKDRPASRPAAPTEVNVDALADQLSDNLINASANEQEQLINRYQRSKGVQYTQALAAAIHKLGGAAKAKARDALQERLARMKPSYIRARLQDDDAEMRAAAALACARKNNRSLIADVIDLLQDPVPRVGQAAYLALMTMTKKDFGPSAGASQAERAAAAVKWKEWWDREGSKK